MSQSKSEPRTTAQESAGGVSRRELLRIAAGAAAASAAVPLAGLAGTVPAVEAAAASPGLFFSASELALLDALTEHIIPTDEHSPGAKAAGVAAYIDRRLSEYDPTIPELQETREGWKAGLQTFDTLAREASGKSFLETAPDAQVALLERLAAREKDPQTEGERFFGQLKRWTARGYYTSKIGIHDEMEYKGNTLQTEYAGIDVASLPPVGPPRD
jgi:hypothetical protein